MRIAFITPEFPTTHPDAGGLSTYVSRMARLLVEAGHEVDVFVATSGRDDRFDDLGVSVHHVPMLQGWTDRITNRFLVQLGGRRSAAYRKLVRNSCTVVAAVEAEHALRPFEVIQSADFLGLGAKLRPSPGRRHVVRCSSAWDLYSEADGRTDPGTAAQKAIEEEAITRADIAYAPSRLVAEHYTVKLRRPVHVIRPPAFLEADPAPRPNWLPPRYLVHVAGRLMRRKGTDAIAAAMPQAVRMAPDLAMLWIGRASFQQMRSWRESMGAAAANVVGIFPLEKSMLYAVMRDAAAVVLPSLVDNLPNTVIESLLLGTPVIGTLGASIDELVQDGVSGKLVNPLDAEALAEVIVGAWRGTLNLGSNTSWVDSPASVAFRPESAISSFLEAIVQVPSISSSPGGV